MPKDKPPQTDAKHNQLTSDEARALRIVHISKLRAQQVIVDKLKADHGAAAAVFTDLFRLAKAETRYDRKELKEHLDDMKLSMSELMEKEERRTALRGDFDLPVGTQAQFDFEKLPREAQDEAHAKGVGYAMGLRGDACEMPDSLHKQFAPAFADGWGKGQTELTWALAEVGKIVDRKPGAGDGFMPAKPQGDSSDDAPLPALNTRKKREPAPA